MEINESNINELVRKCGLNPNKSLGQNFLTNAKVSEQIAHEIDFESAKNVLEIGPGLGSVTHFLSSLNLTAVDVDRRMIDFLKIQYEKNTNISLVLSDILRHDVSGYDKVVGNLPYYITTDIITYLLLNAKNANEMVFMIQREAFPRFAAKVNEYGYGPIAILLSLIGEVKKCFMVKASSFYPNPHVDSLVFKVNIDLDKRTQENFKIYKLAKNLFLNKRKTILNNLSMYTHDKAKASEILTELGIEFTKRPENISVEQYVGIFKLLNK